MSDADVDVTAIIVTFNSEAWIESCLASITTKAGAETEIIVVDNGSSDATVEVAGHVAAQARVHALGENRGFAVAANIGARHALGRYLLLVHPDAELCDGA